MGNVLGQLSKVLIFGNPGTFKNAALGANSTVERANLGPMQTPPPANQPSGYDDGAMDAPAMTYTNNGGGGGGTNNTTTPTNNTQSPVVDATNPTNNTTTPSYTSSGGGGGGGMGPEQNPQGTPTTKAKKSNKVRNILFVAAGIGLLALLLSGDGKKVMNSIT